MPVEPRALLAPFSGDRCEEICWWCRYSTVEREAKCPAALTGAILATPGCPPSPSPRVATSVLPTAIVRLF